MIEKQPFIRGPRDIRHMVLLGFIGAISTKAQAGFSHYAEEIIKNDDFTNALRALMHFLPINEWWKDTVTTSFTALGFPFYAYNDFFRGLDPYINSVPSHYLVFGGLFVTLIPDLIQVLTPTPPYHIKV